MGICMDIQKNQPHRGYYHACYVCGLYGLYLYAVNIKQANTIQALCRPHIVYTVEKAYNTKHEMERYYIRMEVVIMSFFDEMKESLVSAGKDVSQKAKEVSGVAKLKLDVKSKEDYVEKQYAELGRTYFDAHRDDEENAENEQFKVIKEALAEIERMKTEILNLQGAAECPNCGARMPQGASFCSSCGTKMAEPEHFTGEVVDDEKFDE